MTRARYLLLNAGRISVLLSLLAVIASAGTITGTIQGPSGLPVKNSTLNFMLTQPGMAIGTGLIVPSSASCYTSSDGTVIGLPNPLGLPLAAVNTLSGTLPGGTYYVQVAFYLGTSATTTQVSSELQVQLSSTGSLIVSPPVTFPDAATGMAVYIGTASGTETLQGVTAGPTAQFTQSAPLTSGTAAPSINNTVCSIMFNDAIIPYVGYNVSLVSSNGQAYPGFPQVWQLNGGASGTINVSAGTPLWNGTTVYPTAIVSVPLNHGRQSISGPLSGVSSSFIDGSFVAPTSDMTFANNRLFVMGVDNSIGAPTLCCGGRASVGVGNATPLTHFELFSSGPATTGAFYTHTEALPGYSGYMFGSSVNVEADRGSLPKQLFHNFLLADNSGWNIISCSRTSNISTCTVDVTGAPLTLLPGYGFYVSGNVPFHTGASTGIVTAVTLNTVSFSQTGADSGPIAGGVLGPNHLAWSLEVNAFNDNHDPFPVTPTIGQNVAPFWGITSTSDGTFPLSAAYFADSGPYYEGYLCQDPLDACFVAGYPQVGNGTLLGHGFVARPRQVATNGTNYGSMDLQFVDSTFDVTSNYRERGISFAYIPISNAADADGELQITTPMATGFLTDSMQFILPSGSAALPTYGFSGPPGSGMFRDSSGGIHFAAGSADRAQIDSNGVTTTQYNIGVNTVIGPTVTGPHGTGVKLQMSDNTGTSGNLAQFDSGGNVTNGPTAAAVPQVGTPTVGHAACIKAAGPPVVIGFCSTTVDASGLCTCN